MLLELIILIIIMRNKLLKGVSEIQSKYQCFFIDLWGVVHNGIELYSGAINVLENLNKLNKNGYLVIEDIPEFALDTWYIIGNLIGPSFEFNIVRAAKSFVVLLKKIA